MHATNSYILIFISPYRILWNGNIEFLYHNFINKIMASFRWKTMGIFRGNRSRKLCFLKYIDYLYIIYVIFIKCSYRLLNFILFTFIILYILLRLHKLRNLTYEKEKSNHKICCFNWKLCKNSVLELFETNTITLTIQT